MAPRKKSVAEVVPTPIENVEFADEMRSAYRDFSATANLRAIPDIRDGLKPVQRRLLWAIHRMGSKPTGKMFKAMSVVGETMGKYHPFGDAGTYTALTTITAPPLEEEKPFRRLIPFMEGQGNWGTLLLEPAAARYTECRINDAGQYMLGIHEGSAVSEIDEDAIDLVLNYSQDTEEPEVLPALFPSFVVNGAEGIGAPARTLSPSHNLVEAMNLAIKLIDTPKPRWDTIKNIMPGPDLPADCDIFIDTEDGIPSYYEDGYGSFVMRARYELDPKNRTIRITGLPFRVAPETVITGIGNLIKEGELSPDVKVSNFSDSAGINIEVKVGKSVDLDDTINRLLYHGGAKKTGLQVPFSVQSVALVNGKIRAVTPMGAIRDWLRFRRSTIRRRSEFRKAKAEARLEIVLGYLKAIPIAEEIVEIARRSDTRDEAEAEMVTKWSFTERQATAILDMTINQITKLGAARYEKERKELESVIDFCSLLLSDSKALDNELKKEIREVKSALGAERRSRIVYGDPRISKPDTPAVSIPAVNMILSLSPTGWVRASKRIPRSQIVSSDYFTETIRTTDLEVLESISSEGYHYRIPVGDLPSQAVKVASIFTDIDVGEEIVSSFVTGEGNTPDLMLVTNLGRAKRLPYSVYNTSYSKIYDLVPLDSEKGEKVISAFPVEDGDEIALVSDHGYISVIDASVISAKKGRAAGSMPAMRLSNNDTEVIYAGIVDSNSRILYFVPEKKDVVGFIDISDHTLVNRNVKGQRYGKSESYLANRAVLISKDDNLIEWFDGIEEEPSFYDLDTLDRRRFPVVSKNPLHLNLEGIGDANAIWSSSSQENEEGEGE